MALVSAIQAVQLHDEGHCIVAKMSDPNLNYLGGARAKEADMDIPNHLGLYKIKMSNKKKIITSVTVLSIQPHTVNFVIRLV